MILDLIILFNVSPAITLSFFKICADNRNAISREFIKILEKICIKGDRKINEIIRIFSMFYIKELECIYDFCKFIKKFNDKIDDLYEKTKNDLIVKFSKPSALHYIFNFIEDLVQKPKFDEKEVINAMRDTFTKDEFINEFLEEFKDQRTAVGREEEARAHTYRQG